MYTSNPFQSVLDSLREADSVADDKLSELRDLISNAEDAINVVEDYQNSLSDAIDAIEGLGDLSASYTFDYSAEDFDLSPDL